MFTRAQLKASIAALESAKREHTHDCSAPRIDSEGNTSWKSHGDTSVAYGPHGSDFLQIDPASGKIRCGACAGDVNATMKPKVQVLKRDRINGTSRIHLVSQ